MEGHTIDLKDYDKVNMIDPLFKKTTQKFDEMHQGNLMSSTLAINSMLQL